ncbi:MAG: hypothetical protein HOP33_23010, partial [Verrucomicrobia bacterium]|nr:hypothetical protein [Verrucomicrobiota bacterium]
MSVNIHPPPRRILVRGVNWLGDAVMTTPALMRLREKFPHAHITLLTPEKLRDLYLHHPALDETISFGAGAGLFTVSQKLRAGNFDMALVLPNSPRSALEVWLAVIPWRIGGVWPWRNWFLTDVVPPRTGAVKMRKLKDTDVHQLVADISKVAIPPITSPSAHHIHQYLHLVATLGGDESALPPMLAVTDEEITAAKKKFDLENCSAPRFALNPGAEYGPAKRWPAERFIAAAVEIHRQTNCQWL